MNITYDCVGKLRQITVTAKQKGWDIGPFFFVLYPAPLQNSPENVVRANLNTFITLSMLY